MVKQSKMNISYRIDGRFGNNLFQYFATKIIQHICLNKGYKLTYNFNSQSQNSIIIKDLDYLSYLNDEEQLEKLKDKNIYLDGYFQYDCHIIKYKEYIRSIFSIDNTEKINHKTTISDICQTIKDHAYYSEMLSNSIVIHIRLDDFFNERIVVKHDCYIDTVQKLLSRSKNKFNKFTIVVDKLKYPLEHMYIMNLVNDLKKHNLLIDIENNDNMLIDFAKLYWAKYFISSNSTFSYLAGLLGEHKLSYCAKNTCYAHQFVSKFANDDSSEPFDVKYIV